MSTKTARRVQPAANAVSTSAVRLGDIAKLINGDAYKPQDWSTTGVRIIRIQNLNDPAKPFNHWAGELDDRVLVRDGDVLIAWSGTPGTSFGAHRWCGPNGVLNQHIFRVDLDTSRVDPDWFVFAVNQRLDVLIHKAHGGVGLRHVTKGEVERLALPLPPLAEQERIARELTAAMVEVERARRAAQERLASAEALPAAYLREVFEGPQAQEWETRRIDEVCDLLPSKSIATDGDTEVQAITTACLTERGFRPAGIKTARMRGAEVGACTVRRGEVLIARSNTPDLVGRASMFPGEPAGVVASDLTIRIWPREIHGGVTPDFLVTYMSFLFQTGYWRERAGGASGTMKKITREQLSAEAVPVPHIAEQRRIAAELSRRLGETDELIARLRDELALIDALPAALLRRAFGGELTTGKGD